MNQSMNRRDLIVSGLVGIGSPGLMGFAKAPAKKARQKAQCADEELCAERQAQQTLPQSSDPLWTILHACKVGYNAKTGIYSLQPTPQVKAMVGRTVKVKGFTLPLDGSDKTSHFLIGVNTPVCFYHPPGDPNQVIEVVSDHPITWDDKPATVQGTFSLINNGEMGVFFKLIKARQVAS